MMQTARLIAERFHAELIVGYVAQPHISPTDQAALDEKLAISRTAGARIEILEGENLVETLLTFSRSQGVTQLFIGHSQRSGIVPTIFGTPVDTLIRRSRGMDIRIFPQ